MTSSGNHWRPVQTLFIWGPPMIDIWWLPSGHYTSHWNALFKMFSPVESYLIMNWPNLINVGSQYSKMYQTGMNCVV